MLSRLDVGADARIFHLVIDDNLVGIAIQRHALSKLIFGRNDNLFATRELNRALGCTTVRVELAYGRLCTPIGQNLVHLVSVSVDKQSAIRAVPVERNEMVTRLALHGTFAQGYGRLALNPDKDSEPFNSRVRLPDDKLADD